MLSDYQTSQLPGREISCPPLAAPSSTNPITLTPRNPFLFRTRFDLPTIPLPSLSSFSLRKKKDRRPPLDRGLPLDSLPSVVNNRLWDDNLAVPPPRNQTFVCADTQDAPAPETTTSETHLLIPMLSTYSVTTESLQETYRR
jgi:pheromone a factor receptor